MKTWLIALMACLCAAEPDGTTMENLLRTNQFLLVGVNGCNMTVEVDLPNRSCPLHVNDPFRKSSCSWTSVTLLSDPSEESLTPPKVLFFGTVNRRPVAIVKSIKFPNETFSGRHYHSVDVSQEDAKLQFPVNTNLNRMKNIWFDSVQKILYAVVGYSTFTDNMYAYSLDLEKGNDLQLLWSIGVHRDLGLKKWFSDPYTKQFYSYEFDWTGNDPAISVVAVPFTDFVRFTANQHKAEKRVVRRISRDSQDIGVSGGAVFATRHGSSNNSSFTIMSVDGDLVGIRCNSSQPRRGEMLVVRDWDFCKVRDNKEADYEACRGENRFVAPVHHTPQAIVESASSSVLSFLLIIVICLAVLVLAALLVLAYNAKVRYEKQESGRNNVQAAYPTFNSDLSYDF